MASIDTANIQIVLRALVDYLIKPFDVPELLARVRALVTHDMWKEPRPTVRGVGFMLRAGAEP